MLEWILFREGYEFWRDIGGDITPKNPIMSNSYGATSITRPVDDSELPSLVPQQASRKPRRALAIAIVVSIVLSTAAAGAWVSTDPNRRRSAPQDDSFFYKQDPEGEVCSAFDQSADYSKCGRLEPAFFYYWAKEKYGNTVEETCGTSAWMAADNPIPLSEGVTYTHWSAGNAWFVVCNYQILSRLDEYCQGTFQAEEPKQDAVPLSYFGFDGLRPTDEDRSKGWTDPCAAHAFCSACDEGANPYCKAYMQQKLHCSQSVTDYKVHSLFNQTAKNYWCSKVPEIQAGTFEPRRMNRDECASIFFS